MLDALFAVLLAASPGDVGTTETLLRAARYDRNLDAKTPEGFRLGVAFDPDVAASEQEAEAFATAARALEATGSELAPTWVELVPVESGRELYRWMKTQHVSALYVPSALGETVPSIVSAAEAAGVFTFAGSPAAVELGLVVGVRVGDGAKKLVVNMAAADRCGVDFDAVVRQIAERVGDAPRDDGRDELESALARYADAMEKRDLDALRGIWPALDGDDEKRVVASFAMARSHDVAFAVLQVVRRENQASARVRRVDRLVTRDGQEVTAGTVVDISFSHVGDGAWRIESMTNAKPLS